MHNYYNELYQSLEGYTVVKFLGFHYPDKDDPFLCFPRFLMQKEDDLVVCCVSQDDEMNNHGVLIFQPYEG